MTDIGDIIASTDTCLAQRGLRSPAYEVESKALHRLAEEMSRNPNGILAALCKEVLAVCGAESAGISLLGGENDDEFRWPAIAGLWATLEGQGTPRDASPCGMVIEADRSLLIHDAANQFPAGATVTPLSAEILMAPFRVYGKPIGTLWAVMHSDAKRFDREDQRLLESLAVFAAAAYNMTDAVASAGKARDEVKLINLELGHRIKNLLSVITAIASTSLRSATPRAEVLAFQARLQALATAQDMLINQSLGAADIASLAKAVAGRLCEPEQIEVAGPNIVVGPSAALSIALILHELVTNALKYGALTSSSGRVSFTWRITDDDDPRILATWSESGGPAVEPPMQRGFGTRLISMGIIGQGDAEVNYRAEGLQVNFSAPLRSLADRG